MPIYEYECESCGKKLEVWQKITDEPLTTCEACGGRLHKLISQSSFILKGTGWYVTDYARKERKEGKEHGKDSSSSEKRKSEE
ncbi:MAG: zinc ribbon domain-containing protein [Thermodesulfatator sp.]|nr:MAG: zinc ribbon domain-containing protein [Thermodesulfatator sp.]